MIFIYAPLDPYRHQNHPPQQHDTAQHNGKHQYGITFREETAPRHRKGHQDKQHQHRDTHEQPVAPLIQPPLEEKPQKNGGQAHRTIQDSKDTDIVPDGGR